MFQFPVSLLWMQKRLGEDGCDVKLTKGQSSLDGDYASAAQPQLLSGEAGFLENRSRLHFESMGVPHETSSSQGSLERQNQ